MTSQDRTFQGHAGPSGLSGGYETAFLEAAEVLGAMDAGDVARWSGAALTPRGEGSTLVLRFIRDDILISHPAVTVSCADGETGVPLWLQILSLHYLIRARGAPHGGERIGFMQLEGGMGYHPAFQRRTVIPLLKTFGTDIEGFIRAGIASGGRRDGSGAYAVAFQAFPRVEVVFILWEGDGEIPPSGGVVFDSSIRDYLSTEDVAVLCNMITVSMLKAMR